MLDKLKTAWTWIKWLWATATSLISDILKIVWPQWLRAETMWKAYDSTKKIGVVVILLLASALCFKFSVDITRFAFGGYRAASAYGHNLEVSKSDLSGFASQARVDELSAEIVKLKSDVASIDDKIDKAQTSKITTGSVRKIAKKSPAKKSSFSVPDLSKYLP